MSNGFKYVIDEIRNNYQKSAKRNFKLRHPLWINNDPLRKIYSDQRLLASKGKIVYAHLIQANSALFKKQLFGQDLPGLLLYSMDPYYDERPYELGKIAKELYKFKNQRNVPLEIKQFIDLISDEMTSRFNLELPITFTSNRKVYYTTFMVWRKHLTDGYLKGSIFPILVNPEVADSCLIVPSDYWTQEYKNYYNLKILPKGPITKSQLFYDAFPKSMHQQVYNVLSVLPSKTFINTSVYAIGNRDYNLDGSIIKIPYRVLNIEFDTADMYNAMTHTQQMIYHCIFSRSTNGYHRQFHIESLLTITHPTWIIPFIIQICSEYVIELLELIYKNLEGKSNTEFKEFSVNNKSIMHKNYCRMYSYYNAYYKDTIHFNDYVGRKLFIECFGYNKSFKSTK